MPGGDRTGPMGLGPASGRAAGYCAGFQGPGFANPSFGRGGRRPHMLAGRGFNRGGVRGWRHWYYATGLPGWYRWPYSGGYGAPPANWWSGPMPQADEVDALKQQAEYFEQSLNDIRQRIEDLQSEDKES